MKFRKKPVLVEAFQWTGNKDQKEDPVWIVEAIKQGKVFFTKETPNINTQMKIDTLEGLMTASLGDWIILGIMGEIYPCKPDIFEKTYEPVTP